MTDLPVNELEQQIIDGEAEGLNAAQAADVLAEVREDMLAETVAQQDIYRRPPGYAPRPRSGPVMDDARGSEAR